MAERETAGAVVVVIDGDASPLLAKYAQVESTSRAAGTRIATALGGGFGSATGIVDQFGRSVSSGLITPLNEAVPAAQRTATAIRAVGTAAEGTVPEISAMSGAIRVASGEQSIRAIERLGVSVLGLGAAAQAVFPLIGALAVGELISKATSKFGELTEAEKRQNEQTKQNEAEMQRFLKEFDSAEIRRASIEIGQLSSLKLKSFYDESEASADRARLTELNRQLAETQAHANEAARINRGSQNPFAAAVQGVDPVSTARRFVAGKDLEEQNAKIKEQKQAIDKLTDSLRLYDQVLKPVVEDEKNRAAASETGRLRGAIISEAERALAGASAAAATRRSIQESQAHAAVQIQIDEMHDRQAAVVAEATEEVRLAKQKEADITADLAAELPKRVALIRQAGAAQQLGKTPEEIPAIQAETAGKVADAQRDADQKILESHAATVTAEQRLDEANATHAREMFKLVRDSGLNTFEDLQKIIQETSVKIDDAFSKFVNNQARVSQTGDRASTRVSEVTAKGSGATEALRIEGQKLQLAQQYDSEIVHTAAQQIAFAQQSAALDNQARAAKLAGVQRELSIAQQAESANRVRLAGAVEGSEEQVSAAEAEAATREKIATIQQQINELEAAGANAAIEAQTKLIALKEKQSLPVQIQQKAGLQGGVGAAFGALASDTVKNSIDGISNAFGRAIQGGQSFSRIMQQLGKSILGDVVSGIAKIGLQMVTTALIGKAANSAIAAAEAATAAGLGAAWAFVSVLAALPFPANVAAAPGIAAAEGAQILALGLPKFDKGGPITADQIAMVHKGEYVLTADQVAGRVAMPAIPATGAFGIGSAQLTSSMVTNSASHAISIGAIHLHGVRDMQDVARRLPDVLKATSPVFSPATR